MKRHPQAVTDAAAAFDSLPGVGPRAALRYAYWLVLQPKDRIFSFARAIQSLAERIQTCEQCGAVSEETRCEICRDPRRDPSTICVIATNQDLQVIEESGAFHGVYHVLGGLLDPIEGHTPETLRIPELVRRLEQSANVRELIFGFDPDMRGDTTALFLIKQLQRFSISITRFARGLPSGTQIEYADGATVADALLNRRQNKGSAS